MTPLRVLIVDDNPPDALLTIEFIKATKVPVNITTVSDGEQAISVINKAMKRNQLPDVVLLDLNMPKRNGHEVLASFRSDKRTAKMCVIVYTGSSASTDEEQAAINKANAYMIKPMGGKEMDETIAKLREILTKISRGSYPPPIGNNS